MLTVIFRIRKIFFSTLLLLLTLRVAAQPVNQNLSNSIGWDGEPYLACNPEHSENLIVAWMSFQLPFRLGIEVKSSMDSGQTWSNSIFLPQLSNSYTSADVSIAFGHGYEVYLSYINSRQNPDSGGVFVVRSTDGGASWSAPVRAIDVHASSEYPVDRPWIVIDNSNTASDGTLYITTKPVSWSPVPNRPTYTVSTDRGITWTPLRFADTTGFTSTIINSPMAAPAVDAGGTFHMAYPAIVNFLPAMVLASSADQGSTFHRSVFLSPAYLSTDTNPKQAWKLCTDPTNVDNLYFFWTNNSNGDLDIYTVFSHDHGQNWSSPLRINDDALSNGNMQDMLWATVSPDDGSIVTAWRDRRNAPDTGFFQPFDIYTSMSTDGGISYNRNVKITDTLTPFDTMLSSAGNDFLSVDAGGNKVHYSWSDYRSGELELYYANILTSGLNLVPTTTDMSFEVYPVPARDVLYIRQSGKNSGTTDIQLLDIYGRTVTGQKVENHGGVVSISLAKLGEGIYFLKLGYGLQSCIRFPVIR
ncbi:MAG TPA: exo-alpha-sialidase [Bacteroidia bacterium]|nr:exo-alpha-sialidase [Bacteroidia bacterium]